MGSINCVKRPWGSDRFDDIENRSGNLEVEPDKSLMTVNATMQSESGGSFCRLFLGRWEWVIARQLSGDPYL
jgi:hypothetical protein